MSAVPKKKLCWNCEGNIDNEVDNCPYCGVYVHSPELDGMNNWTTPYFTENKTEEIPSPLYQLHSVKENTGQVAEESSPTKAEISVIQQLKNDVLPTLLLMTGSIFFLFGLILFLFSNQGTLTLQWNADYWPFFLFFSIPCVFFGWKFLMQIDPQEEDDLF